MTPSIPNLLINPDHAVRLIVELATKRLQSRCPDVPIARDALIHQRLTEAAQVAVREFLHGAESITLDLRFIAVNDAAPIHLHETLTRTYCYQLAEADTYWEASGP
jgi:hypothetical protein